MVEEQRLMIKLKGERLQVNSFYKERYGLRLRVVFQFKSSK